MSTLWHNGAFKDETDTLLTASDRALRGHGVFDTMLVIDRKLCHAQKHFDRLKHDANIVGITINKAFEDIAQELLEKNNSTAGRYALNTTVTGGPGARGLTPPDSPEPQIIMRLSPLPDEFPPIEAITSKAVRRNEGSPLSNIKSINYGDNILALNEARAVGANEATMLNNAGNVTCTTVGNIYAMIDGALYTPPLSDGAMAGITRALLLEHHDIQEKTLTTEDLQTADGIYISNSIRGLEAVTSLNGNTISATEPNIPKDFHE